MSKTVMLAIATVAAHSTRVNFSSIAMLTHQDVQKQQFMSWLT